MLKYCIVCGWLASRLWSTSVCFCGSC